MSMTRIFQCGPQEKQGETVTSEYPHFKFQNRPKIKYREYKKQLK